jgi:hypothetical protein
MLGRSIVGESQLDRIHEQVQTDVGRLRWRLAVSPLYDRPDNTEAAIGSRQTRLHQVFATNLG